MYGLKQAPLQWYKEFNSFLQQIGLNPTKSDKCIYTDVEKKIILILYIDDGIVCCKEQSDLNSVISAVQNTFKIKVTSLQSYLGINIEPTQQGIKLSQESFITSLLEECNLNECRPTKTPIQPGTDLFIESNEVANVYLPISYRTAIGKLLYIATRTRPDIAFSVITASQFCTNYSDIHLLIVKQCIKYLSGSRHLALKYEAKDSFTNELVTYCDADFANVPDSKSFSGVIFAINNCIVHWICKKQSTVSTSTTHAECNAVDLATRELIWFRELLSEIGYTQSQPSIL